MGRGVGSTGGLTISGAGSTVEFVSTSLNPGIGVSGGSGAVSLAGGSSITLFGTVGGEMSVGRSGTGVLSVGGGSTVNVGSSSILVGCEPGGVGLVTE